MSAHKNSPYVSWNLFLWRIIMILIALFATVMVLSPPKKGMFEDVEEVVIDEPTIYKSCKVIEETEHGVLMGCLK